MANSLNELAAKIGLPIEDVLRAAREIRRKSAIDANYRVDFNEEGKIKRFLKFEQERGASIEPPVVQIPPSSDSHSASSLDLNWKKDVRAKFEDLQFPELNFKIWCHQDVYEGMQNWQLSKKTTMAIRQIVAMGHTSVAKGCSDAKNRGWLRSPLGGGSGNHYYLWWARQGSQALLNSEVGKNDIVVRSIRLHDNHEAMNVGGMPDDYIQIAREKLGSGAGEFESPWNDQQLKFIESDDPVRLAIGKPGSGKTTVLWQSIDLRTDQDVLYATWSPKLVEETEKHFQAFGPIGTRLHPFDFASLLGHICGKDLERQTLIQAREKFESALPKDARATVLGPWKGYSDGLFAEVRAYLLGLSSVEFPDDKKVSAPIPWEGDAYIASATKRIGREAARAVVDVVEDLEKRHSLETFFPELGFAVQAVLLLRQGKLPKGFENFTRIVVDEIQDLTLIELSVFVELCLAISRVSGYSPFLLMAGDEGQTVRPTGFEWATLSNLISKKLKDPVSFSLQESVRYPQKIADVLENASNLYAEVDKAKRPRKQTRTQTKDYRQAQIFHVTVGDRQSGIDLLTQLVNVDGLAVISAAGEIPEWMGQQLGMGVLTPSESKGLEYQSVCVINPGVELAAIGQPTTTQLSQLEDAHRRTRIDQLRVAMSRATETLVFIDIGATDQELELSRKLLGGPAASEPSDLIGHVTSPDLTPEERVLGRLRDARTLIETRPERAWQLAAQALDLLGEPALHNGVTDESVRTETVEVVMGVATRLLADGIPDGLSRSSIFEAATEAVERLNSKELSHAFLCFSQWVSDEIDNPFDLLDSISEIKEGGQWLRSSLSGKTQTLRKALDDGASDLRTAGRFSGQVEKWLGVCGFAGDVEDECNQLRRLAVDALLIDRKYAADAEKVFMKIKENTGQEDQLRLGRIKECLEQWELAAQAFERAGSPKDAIKSWRSKPDWASAVRVAREAGIVDKDLDWLYLLQSTAKGLPAGLNGRLHENEKRQANVIRGGMKL